MPADPSTATGVRYKYIHSVGNVATIKLESSGDHPFTGIFEGSNHGVMRMSVASNPDPTVLNLRPGMGLKFLRDGMESVSMVAMYQVAGQDSWNFFAHDWSNHVDSVTDPSLAGLNKKFSTGSIYTQTVGLSDFAGYTTDGSKVDSPVFPWKLRFHPTGEFEFPN